MNIDSSTECCSIFLFSGNETFDQNFIESIEKDKKKLQDFFYFAVQNKDFWNNQNLDFKKRIIKAIDASRDLILRNTCIQIINNLSQECFKNVFKDLEHLNVVGFFEGTVEFSILTKEDIAEILSFTFFIRNSNTMNIQNSNYLLNSMLFKKYDETHLAVAWNRLKFEDITETNVSKLLKVARICHANELKTNCLLFLSQKIGIEDLKMLSWKLFAIVKDLNKVNTIELKKYIQIFEKIKITVKISLWTSESLSIDDYTTKLFFISVFKSNIYKLNLSGNRELADLSSVIECLTNLHTLNFSNCSELKKLNDKIGKLTSLEVLNLSHCTSLTTISCEIGLLTNLRTLNLSGCSELMALPEEIGQLRNIRNLYLSNCSKLKTLCTFENFIHIREISIPSNLDSFTLIKAFYELKCIRGKRDMGLGKIFSRTFFSFARKFMKTMNLLDLRNIDFINSFDREKSDLSSLNAMLLLAHVLPQNKDIIFSILFDPCKKIKIIDRNFFNDFKSRYEKSIQENFKIDCLENFLIAIDLGVEITDQTLLKNMLRLYFESRDEIVRGIFILSDEIEEFLKSNEGKKILVEFRQDIFKNNSSITNFVMMNYPGYLQENIDLYPIKVKLEPSPENDLGLLQYVIEIVCHQEQVKSEDFIVEFLTKISEAIDESNRLGYSSNDLYVSYYGQKGIDAGGLRRDFVFNLFMTISESWGLSRGISELGQEKLKLLGPILTLILTCHQTDYVIGDVFVEDYFKGMLAFDYNQIINDFKKLNFQEILNISLAFRTNEKRKVSEDILNFLSWDGSEAESCQKVLSLLRLSYDEDIMNEIKKMLPDSNTFNYIDLQKKDFVGVDEVNSYSLSNVLRKRCSLDYSKKNPKPKKLKIDFTLEIQNQIDTIIKLIFDKKKLDQLKTLVLETVFQDVSNQVLNLHYILSSMKLSQAEWSSIKTDGLKAFMLMLHGETFSKEKVLEIIYYDSGVSEETKQYLQEWFLNSDEYSLKKFLLCITERTSIPKKRITIFPSNVFKVSGCGGYLDVPNNLNKEQIFHYMKNIVDGKDSFDLT